MSPCAGEWGCIFHQWPQCRLLGEGLGQAEGGSGQEPRDTGHGGFWGAMLEEQGEAKWFWVSLGRLGTL